MRIGQGDGRRGLWEFEAVLAYDRVRHCTRVAKGLDCEVVDRDGILVSGYVELETGDKGWAKFAKFGSSGAGFRVGWLVEHRAPYTLVIRDSVAEKLG